jgi:hypothetical protein
MTVDAQTADALRGAIRAGVDVRHDVRIGRQTVAQALDDPRAAWLHVNAVLDAQPGWPTTRTDTLLVGLRIWPLKAVGQLTDSQRAAIVGALARSEGRAA